MFNMYLFEKRSQESDLRSSSEFQREKRAQTMKQRNEVMASKYKQRVGHFIRSMMVEKPHVHVDTYRGDAAKDKYKFTTPRGFRFTSSQDERVADAVERNQIYESSPTRRTLTNETSEQILNLRPRDERKEILGNFRFKPTSQAERIAESLALNNGTKFPKSIVAGTSAKNRKIKKVSLRPVDMQGMEIRANQTSTAQFGSILTARNQMSIDTSKARASSTSRAADTSRTSGYKIRNTRHQSVPFNKSGYSRRFDLEASKTFFKGAVEYLQVSERASLGDNDQSLKKILDDSKVAKIYNESLRRSREEDLINSGTGSFRQTSKKVSKSNIRAKNFVQSHRSSISKTKINAGLDLSEILHKSNINPQLLNNSSLQMQFPQTTRLNTISSTPAVETPVKKRAQMEGNPSGDKQSPFIMIQTAEIGNGNQVSGERLPPVGYTSSQGLNSSQYPGGSRGNLTQQLEEAMNVDQQSHLDPKQITKQMLLTCRVFRKRNSNVTPLVSHKNQSKLAVRTAQKQSPPPSQRRIPAQVFEPPSQQSLNEYLDAMSFEAKLNRTAVVSRECDVTYPAELLHNNVRTAAVAQRPSHMQEEMQRASTVENPQGRQNLAERKIPMVKPIKKFLKPRQLTQTMNMAARTEFTQSRSTIRVEELRHRSREDSAGSTDRTQPYTASNAMAIQSNSLFSKK